MTKKVACRACGFKTKAEGAPDKCPECGGGDWKKVYKPRAAKEAAEPKKKKGKKTAKKAGRKKRAPRKVDPIVEKRFAVMARAVSDTSPHEPRDAFIAWTEGGLAGFSTKAPSVNDEEYLIPLPVLNEVVYLWLHEHPGTWAFEVIEPQIARTIEAISYTQALTTGDPSIDGELIRDAAKLTPTVDETPRFVRPPLGALPPKDHTIQVGWSTSADDADVLDEEPATVESLA